MIRTGRIRYLGDAKYVEYMVLGTDFRCWRREY